MKKYRKTIQRLIKNGITISAMESCTGGLLMSTITNESGSSAITKGGIVTYSNDSKIQFGVLKSTIYQHGVYSEDTARDMAMSVKEIFDSNIGIGITGQIGEHEYDVHYVIFVDGIEDYQYIRSLSLMKDDRKSAKTEIVKDILKELDILLDKLEKI